jgi:hypothetical protein
MQEELGFGYSLVHTELVDSEDLNENEKVIRERLICTLKSSNFFKDFRFIED